MISLSLRGKKKKSIFLFLFIDGRIRIFLTPLLFKIFSPYIFPYSEGEKKKKKLALWIRLAAEKIKGKGKEKKRKEKKEVLFDLIRVVETREKI